MKILIVDDEVACRITLQHHLKPYGECHMAGNGREAFNAFRAALDQGAPFDLICLDVMMPEMNGVVALQEIRREETTRGIIPVHGVKVIMATAVDDPLGILDAFRSLCDAYVIKPVDPARLLDYIKVYGLIQ